MLLYSWDYLMRRKDSYYLEDLDSVAVQGVAVWNIIRFEVRKRGGVCYVHTISDIGDGYEEEEAPVMVVRRGQGVCLNVNDVRVKNLR